MDRRTFAQTIAAVVAAAFGRPIGAGGFVAPTPRLADLPTLEVQGADEPGGPWREVSEIAGEPRYLRIAIIEDAPSGVHFGAEPYARGWYRIWATSADGRYTGSVFIRPQGGTKFYGLYGVQVEASRPEPQYILTEGARTNACCGKSAELDGAVW